MKIIETLGKVNFVDKNNVFVGYDLEQQCCECADWSIYLAPPKDTAEIRIVTTNLDEYVFDTDFFNSNSIEDEDTGSVCFRLVSTDGKELFLCLWNCHNGYYTHGFTFSVDGEVKYKDVL
jgi:hypothetical protein